MLRKPLLRLILTVLFSFFALLSLVTCRQPFSPGDNVDFSDSGNRTQDDNYYTVYLDGGAPASRSLSRPNASSAFDFCEAVFYYRDVASSGDIVARATWDGNQKAQIQGVFRTINGIDYGHVSYSGTPADGFNGAAVLFVGKKSDKTLLGVGEIYAVDDVPTGGGPALIKSTTKKVSFQVNAFKAGAKATPAGGGSSSYTAIGSSFITNADGVAGSVPTTGNTRVRDVGYVGRTFPLYGLNDVSETRRARYTIDVHSAVHPISYYLPGIILSGTAFYISGAAASAIQPKYTDGTKEYISANLLWNNLCSAVLANNTGNNVPFDNNIDFNITTTNNTGPNEKNVVFAVTFEIPVCALAVSADAVPWVIRPGYDQYKNELDDGRGGQGGAILIGLGDMEKFFSYALAVQDYPRIRYNSVDGWTFDIYNKLATLKCEIRTSEGARLGAVDNSLLEFYFDIDRSGTINYATERIYPNVLDSDGNVITAGFDFLHDQNAFMDEKAVILIRYTDASMTYSPFTFETTYQITIGAAGTVTQEIPPNHIRLVTSPNDIHDLYSNVNLPTNVSGIFLWAFSGTFDLPNITLNIPAGVDITIIITAVSPNTIIGRSGTFNVWGNGTLHLYMGQWPFTTLVTVGGAPIEDFPFGFNAGGSFATYSPTLNSGATLGTTWLRYQYAPIDLTVVGGDVYIDNPGYMGPAGGL